MKEQNNGSPRFTKEDKIAAAKILTTVALSVVVFAFYRFALAFDFFFPIVMWSYMVILAVLALVYVLYNRGFSRKGVTADMLPDEWSEEKKQAFILDAARRIKRSGWMLMLIIAFLMTFLFEAIELFVLPMFSGLF